MPFALDWRMKWGGLTALRSLRLGVGFCEVGGRRSLRATWETSPRSPWRGLDGVGPRGSYDAATRSVSQPRRLSMRWTDCKVVLLGTSTLTALAGRGFVAHAGEDRFPVSSTTEGIGVRELAEELRG